MNKQAKNGKASDADKTRLDKWLWAARFYKTRVLASEAVSGGHVHLNNQRVKPSRTIQPGDRLTISKSPYIFEIEITGLSVRRGAAKEARKLYTEDDKSIAAREKLMEQRRLDAAQFPHPDRRPDKRDRRRIIRFKNINREK